MSKAILILGGAGYIGSHTAYLMHSSGYKVIILDKFLHKQTFSPSWATVIKGDFADTVILKRIFTTYKIDAVMQFAALIEVGESVKRPRDFYENNVLKTLKFLDVMLKYNVKKIVFSSTCAIYGSPKELFLDETDLKDPLSPYGKSKLAVEFVLQDYSQAYNLNYVALRYFNAAGALPEQNLGEQHDPETHIIPLMLRAIKNKKTFKVFGGDYNTPDGTCIRDYVHVLDIAQAHILALDYLEQNNRSNFFNLGTGFGYSVKQMIKAAEKVCNDSMIVEYCSRRSGDAEVLVANPEKAKRVLNWSPKYSDLDNILRSAWAWEIFFVKNSLQKQIFV